MESEEKQGRVGGDAKADVEQVVVAAEQTMSDVQERRRQEGADRFRDQRENQVVGA